MESWIPLFLFRILFGLSMDYHVFLLYRTREHYDQSGNTNYSVAFGIPSIGRLITGAGLFMSDVFWGFSIGSLVGLQQMDFGLGLAIWLDATIVWYIIALAFMTLRGNWDWYLPSWMEGIPNDRFGPSNDAPVGAPSDD